MKIKDFDKNTQDLIHRLNALDGVSNLKVEIVIGNKKRLMKFKNLKKALGI